MSDVAQEIRDRQKAVWALGDYSTIAGMLEPASHALLDSCAVGPNTRLLDVGTGSGNLALEAARRGASVVGSDLTPHLLEIAKNRAAAEKLAIEWREADAENLPFEDGTFDVVTSVFGAMFAPRAQAAAAEMLRVTKPGGLVGFTAWHKDGYTGKTFELGSKYQPPAPEGIDVPWVWGDEDVARRRFEAAGAEVHIRESAVIWEFDSMEDYRKQMEEAAPPMVAAKMAMPPETFEELKKDFDELDDRFNRSESGGVEIESTYLEILARKPS